MSAATCLIDQRSVPDQARSRAEVQLPPRTPEPGAAPTWENGREPPAERVGARGAQPRSSATVLGRGTIHDVTATDTFASFVDHLAQALDEPQAQAWERLHFSRFHFDRLIRGVAGEPPAAFRRRILLERAAYRMITTTAPLLDIAVEAGYGSHEAFTRAFTKAYGVAPAVWRTRPTQIRIAAPS